MATTAQVLKIISILCAPMLSIAALVLTLAALNWSLGMRKLYVKLLALIFDYATKIKQDKQVPIATNMSSDEPPTPIQTRRPAKLSPSVVEKSPDNPFLITPQTPLVTESKEEHNEDRSESSPEITPTTTTDQRGSRTSSQTDIQFKLGKSICFCCRKNDNHVQRIFIIAEKYNNLCTGTNL